ncbi:MAG: response regulator [Caulobacteraceae bacterium]
MARRKAGGAGGLRVLVVEDESLLAMLLEDMVTELGCRVVGPVGALSEALEIAKGSPPFDCAILDIDLHGVKAYPIADALAERAIPFIFTTGYGREHLAGRFEDVPFLQKPFQISQLRDAIERFYRPVDV